MYIVFGDMYGNYVYDSIVNDTAILSDFLFDWITNGMLEENSIQIEKEYAQLKEKVELEYK